MTRRPQRPGRRQHDGRSSTVQGRNTGYYQRLRAAFRADCARRNTPCWLCRQPITYTLRDTEPDGFSVDHVKPLSLAPELAEDVTNWRPAHVRCNQSRGNRDVLDLGTPSRDW